MVQWMGFGVNCELGTMKDMILLFGASLVLILFLA